MPFWHDVRLSRNTLVVVNGQVQMIIDDLSYSTTENHVFKNLAVNLRLNFLFVEYVYDKLII